MRLTPEQIGTIRRIVKVMLPKAVSVSLFGSRVDDTRRVVISISILNILKHSHLKNKLA